MSEQVGDLVNALAGKEGAASNGVTEAVHGRNRAVRDRDWVAGRVGVVENREGWSAVVCARSCLGGPKGAGYVALTDRAAAACGEHEIGWRDMCAAAVMVVQDLR
jgi:hypothetical protein